MGMLTRPQAPQQPPPKKGDRMQPNSGSATDAYDSAMTFVRKALYGKEAARDVAKSLRAAQDPAQGLADTAYQMVTIADERTNGEIPDEELIAFASEVLGEVADIAKAAGVEVKGAVIAKAVRIMLLRYVSEQGLDITQLQQAMDGVDPEAVGAELDKEM